MDVPCRGKLPELGNGLVLHRVAVTDLVVGAYHELQIVHNHVLNVVNIGRMGHSLGREVGEGGREVEGGKEGGRQEGGRQGGSKGGGRREGGREGESEEGGRREGGRGEGGRVSMGMKTEP